jgi:hypothetical protein
MFVFYLRDSGNPDEVSHLSKSFINSNAIMADKNDPDRFSFFNHFLSPWASGRGWARTLDLRMMRRVFYHCAAAAVCP